MYCQSASLDMSSIFIRTIYGTCYLKADIKKEMTHQTRETNTRLFTGAWDVSLRATSLCCFANCNVD